MADSIDTLQLDIIAEINDALGGIDSIASALDSFSSDRFVTQLGRASVAIESLSRTVNGLDLSVLVAGSDKLNNLVSKGANDLMREYGLNSKEAFENISEGLRMVASGNYTDGIERIGQSIEKAGESAKKFVTITPEMETIFGILSSKGRRYNVKESDIASWGSAADRASVLGSLPEYLNGKFGESMGIDKFFEDYKDQLQGAIDFTQSLSEQTLQLLNLYKQAREYKEGIANGTMTDDPYFRGPTQYDFYETLQDPDLKDAEVPIRGIINELQSMKGEVAQEASGFQVLIDRINAVTQAVNAKTQAFREEGDVAAKSLGDEASKAKSLMTAIANLSSGKHGASMTSFAAGLRDLSSAIQGLNVTSTLVANVMSLSNAVSKLGGGNVNNAIKVTIPQMQTAFQTMSSALGGLTASDASIATLEQFAHAFSALGSSNARAAVTTVPSLTAAIQGLVTAAKDFEYVDKGLAQLAESISRLGGVTSQRAVTSIPQLGDALKQLMQTLKDAPQVSQNLIDMTNALANLSSQGQRVNSISSGLTRNVGRFSLPFKTATHRTKGLASAIGMFYAKWFLVLRALKTAWKGVDLAAQLTEVQNVVDNVFPESTIDRVNEFAKDVALAQYGMSELFSKEVSSRFMAMQNAMGINDKMVQNITTDMSKLDSAYRESNKSATDMALTMTRLTADMASFFNKDYADVAKDLEAVYTGQTKTLRKYGIDLTQANLQEFAASRGIDKKVKSMTQAEKTMLRYQYVLDRTRAAQGDFLRTQDTWSNRMRLLTEQIKQFGTVTGGIFVNAFKPALAALNSLMSAVISAAKVISNALGFIFGWTYEEGGGGGLSDVADAVGDIEDGMGGAADNAKKLKDYTMGIDELNIIDPDKGSSGGGGGGGAGVGGKAADGGQWVKREKSLKKYLSDIDSLFDLGDKIASSLEDTLRKIDWPKVYEAAGKFGSGLADFLNGLIKPSAFYAIGQTVAGALNTALRSLNDFGHKFNWINLGNSIAQGINGFFRTFDFGLAADTFNTFAIGFLTSVKTALEQVDWESVGTGIGTFLAGIDYLGIFLTLVDIVAAAWSALFRTAVASFDKAPIQTALLLAVGAIFAGINVASAASEFLKSVEATVGNIKKIATALTTFLGPEATAVLAVAAGIGVVVSWIVALRDNAAKRSEIGQYAKAIGDLADEIDRNNQSIESSITTQQDHVNGAGKEEAALARKLWEEYQKLADETENTAGQQALMRDLAAQLVQVIPGLNEMVDKETGLITAQKDEVEKLITKTESYFKLQAVREKLVDAYKLQIEAETNLKDATEKSEKAVEDYLKQAGLAPDVIKKIKDGTFDLTEVQKELDNYYIINGEHMSDQAFQAEYGAKNFGVLSKAVESVNKAQKEYNESLSGAQQAYNDASSWVATLTDMYKDLTTEAEIVGPEVKTSMETAGKNAVEGFNAGIENNLSLIKPVTSKFANTVITDVHDGPLKFGSPSKAMEDFGKDTIQGYINGITIHTDDTEEPINTWAKKIITWFTGNGEGDDKINASAWEKFSTNIIDSFRTTITNRHGDDKSSVDTWAKDIITWFTGDGNGTDKINLTAWQSFSQNIISGFKTNTESKYQETKGPVDTWVKGLISWFTNDEKDGGVNKTTWEKFSKSVIDSFGSYVTSHHTDTKSPLETWNSKVREWFWGSSDESENSGLAKRFFDFGKNIMQGLVNGLQSLWETVQNKFTSLAQMGDDAYTDFEGIDSPSKNWYSFGRYDMMGLANGISDYGYLVQEAITGVGKNLTPIGVDTSIAAPNVSALGGKLAASSEYSLTAYIEGAIDRVIEGKLIPVMRENADNNSTLLQQIADKDTDVYLDSRKVNSGLRAQAVRSGYSLRRN